MATVPHFHAPADRACADRPRIDRIRIDRRGSSSGVPAGPLLAVRADCGLLCLLLRSARTH